MTEDAELLRRYADSRSEAAFAELVQRRIGLVYAVAWRQTRDAHRAEEVVQAVFADLARKAASLSRRPVLIGWLYRSTQFAAADIVRAEQRRALREQAADTMQKLFADEPSDLVWEKVHPVLDEAMSDLNELDRDVILLRFFDDLSFATIGTRLRLTENTARMRVARALDKLHAALARRGVTSTAATLGMALACQASSVAPAGLAATVTGAALAGAAMSSGAAIISFMAASKLQMGLAAAVVVAGVGTLAVYRRDATIAHPLVADVTATASAASTTSMALAPAIAKPLATMPPASAVIAPPARAPVIAPNPNAGGRTNQIERWLADADDPAALRKLSAEARTLTLNRFGDLFTELNLGPERTEALARLLDEKRQAPMDVAVASHKNGIDPRNDMAAFEASVASTRAKIEREIQATLGETVYARYGAYNQQQGVIDTFIRVGRTLNGTPDALTPEQSAQLQVLLKAGLSGSLSVEKIDAARAFLSPPQLQALQQAMEQHQNIKAERFQQALPPSPEK